MFGTAGVVADFLSCGGKAELSAAARIASAIAPGAEIVRLRDRDTLPDAERVRLLDEDLQLRVLDEYSIESYLLNDEILHILQAERCGPGDLVGHETTRSRLTGQ